MHIATFGAGCFWCVEAVFQNLIGVHKVVSGYMGGKVKNPTYREICRGTTDHAEVIQITYDSDKISFPDLLEVFFSTHDPTTLNRQGNDRGTQYRSAIFYHNDQQKIEAQQALKQVAEPLYDDPIVTEITAASAFYEAEPYHQDYYNRNGYAPYCRFVISPKVSKFRSKFSHRLKPNTHE